MTISKRTDRFTRREGTGGGSTEEESAKPLRVKRPEYRKEGTKNQSMEWMVERGGCIRSGMPGFQAWTEQRAFSDGETKGEKDKGSG